MKRLYRIKEGRMLGGVCTGLGKYLDLDPTLMRVVWIMAFFPFSFGIIPYIIAWMIIPSEPAESLAC